MQTDDILSDIPPIISVVHKTTIEEIRNKRASLVEKKHLLSIYKKSLYYTKKRKSRKQIHSIVAVKNTIPMIRVDISVLEYELRRLENDLFVAIYAERMFTNL
jgi:hypothetical protein